MSDQATERIFQDDIIHGSYADANMARDRFECA